MGNPEGGARWQVMVQNTILGHVRLPQAQVLSHIIKEKMQDYIYMHVWDIIKDKMQDYIYMHVWVQETTKFPALMRGWGRSFSFRIFLNRI